MADTPTASASPPGGDLEQRLARLEELLHRNQALRRKAALTSRLGLLLILAVFTIFIYRIVAHFNDTYVRPLRETPELFMRDLATKIELEKVLQRELEIAGEELIKRGTDFAGRVANRVMARSGEMEEKVAALAERLQEHATVAFEDRLHEALEKSLQETLGGVEKDLEVFKGEAFEKNLALATSKFNERLADIVEERLAIVGPSLNGLKDAANRVGRSEGSEKLKGANPGEVEEMLLNTLLELAAYELSPELGKPLVTPAAEGAKP